MKQKKIILYTKISVSIFLLVTLFANIWIFELYEYSVRNNYNTLRSYIMSRNIDLSWYDKFIYQEPILTNGFRHDTPDKVYHILMYLHILSTILAVTIIFII